MTPYRIQCTFGRALVKATLVELNYRSSHEWIESESRQILLNLHVLRTKFIVGSLFILHSYTKIVKTILNTALLFSLNKADSRQGQIQESKTRTRPSLVLRPVSRPRLNLSITALTAGMMWTAFGAPRPYLVGFCRLYPPGRREQWKRWRFPGPVCRYCPLPRSQTLRRCCRAGEQRRNLMSGTHWVLLFRMSNWTGQKILHAYRSPIWHLSSRSRK